ncbi:MAG TPA: ABC transporter substrate-binding protein, partial [Chthoniobacterales bacterium]|nr:ABC transporter substrate-binding protein [Chthoniobacterales bacterium]
KETVGTKPESKKVRVGYIGLTCEASIFSAVENGYFKDEGLEVELIKCDWKNYKDTLALGGYDITQHLVMYFLKPIEQGLDVKFTGGIHTGCLRVQASAKSDITTVEQLRGKRIGVPGMGTPPFVYSNRVLKRHGIDGSKEIEWKVFPVGELGLAIDKGEVDAVADSEPIGTMLLTSGKVRNVADQAADEGYKDEYCCEVIANGKWLAANPKAAAGATCALLRGAKYVHANPMAAAQMSIDKKYLASNPKMNAAALSKLGYIPSVSRAESSVTAATKEMIAAGMLAPNTNVEELAKRAFAHLDGVTDEWIDKAEVKKVAGGQTIEEISTTTAAVAASTEKAECCAMPLVTN